MGVESIPSVSVDADVVSRAALHAALAEPLRLAIVDDLAVSDRSPSELGARLGLSSNLLAHHVDVLVDVGLIERLTSAGDKRRRYLSLRREPLRDLGVGPQRLAGDVLFVCSHNSARSQLAAALYEELTGEAARSAGTDPAPSVHPGAVAAATRYGLDLTAARPRALEPDETADLVITVCDMAHEGLDIAPEHWHWSIPDPAAVGTDAAFDAALDDLEQRMTALLAPT